MIAMARMHIVLVQITVKPEMLDEFERALLHNARESVARDPGCLRFDVSQGKDDPLTWVAARGLRPDEAAHAAHRQSAHFLAFEAVAARAVTGESRASSARDGTSPSEAVSAP